jgi:hypothetical protein
VIRRPLVAVVLVGIVVAGCASGGSTPAPAAVAPSRSDPSAPAAQASDDFIDVPGIGSTRVDVPRPASGTSAPCDADPLPPSTTETTVQRVTALRAAGLFADTSVSVAELATRIDDTIADQWGADLPPDDPLRDLVVAAEDHDRVWWGDLEADVSRDNDVYASLIQALAMISLGAFQPTSDITETWAGDEGPVAIDYTLADGPQHLAPAYLEDWIDPMIIGPINDSIAGSGRRFDLYRAFDQGALIIALTPAERTALESRGWCFE